MKQVNVLCFFFAIAIMAVLTGCPGPEVQHPDMGMPGDAGPDSDGNIDVPDAGPDSEVLPDGGTDDLGQDGGTVDPCADPEYVGIECNLPADVVYSRDAFLCAVAIDRDRWSESSTTASMRVTSSEVEGVLYSSLDFAGYNPNWHSPSGLVTKFTCGPEGVCWFNWKNPASHYPHCKVSFLTDCSLATVECWLPGASSSEVNQANYIGPA